MLKEASQRLFNSSNTADLHTIKIFRSILLHTMNLLSYIPTWLRNKYVIAVLVFAVWMIFFDDRNIYTTHYELPRQLKELQKSKSYYEEQIAITRKELNELKDNPKTVEKYAREKYFMKRENEDLFITNK